MKTLLGLVFITTILGFSTKGPKKKVEGGTEWKLLWEEPFDTLDRDIWSLEIGNNGWGNWETQMFTDRKKNAFVKDGVLNVALLRDPHYGWTSARMTSIFGFSMKYGMIKVRMKLDKGAHGIFPAFWMLPTYSVYGKWPNSGEIDLFEYQTMWYGKLTNVTAFSNIHFGAHNGGGGLKYGSVPVDVEKFFEITCIWEKDSINYFLNDVWYGGYEKPQEADYFMWPFDQEFHFIINNSMQPFWGTAPTDELMESYFQIDYIKVYQRKGSTDDMKVSLQ